jgi:membrane protein implicated in regulation of membrane protease activity
MVTYYASLNGLERFFAVCAAIGGITMLVRIVLMLLGAEGSDIADADVADADLAETADVADGGFRIISLQGLTSFFMMFGLVGLALSRQSQASAALSVAGGVGAGLLSMIVIAQLFRAMTRLQSDGTLNMLSAVGQTGTVYLTVKPRSGGKVSVVIQGRLCVLNAVTEGDTPIPTGEAIKVDKVIDGRTLVVSRLDSSEYEDAS